MLPAQVEKGEVEAVRDREATISVCIVCRNESDKLGPCLESVAWADEILVMDLRSTDDSAALAESHGARVIKREPYPIVEPLRNELAAMARGAWVLAMDPDERVTPGLADELRRAAQRPELDAVVIPFTNYDLGYPPTAPIHRYEAHLRMYRPARVPWPTVPNTQPAVADERKYQIPNDDRLVMIHDRSRNVPEIVDRVMRYAPLQGQSMLDQGQVFSARAMLLAMAQVVDKQFVDGRPWEDGVPGMLRAGVLVAFKFYVWVAFWQVSGAKRTPEDDRFLRRWGPVLILPARAVRFGARVYRSLRRSSRS
jgi:glycosyltransferase involved in cell wall biosynthesis